MADVQSQGITYANPASTLKAEHAGTILREIFHVGDMRSHIVTVCFGGAGGMHDLREVRRTQFDADQRLQIFPSCRERSREEYYFSRAS
jgi:hypothetical protein